MPIYEYRCSSCGFQKEYLRKLSDPVLTVCPEGGKQTFCKMLSAAGFQLKGSAWHATPLPNSGAKPAPKRGPTTTPGPQHTAHAQPDAKPPPQPGTELHTTHRTHPVAD